MLQNKLAEIEGHFRPKNKDFEGQCDLMQDNLMSSMKAILKGPLEKQKVEPEDDELTKELKNGVNKTKEFYDKLVEKYLQDQEASLFNPQIFNSCLENSLKSDFTPLVIPERDLKDGKSIS